MAAQVGGTAFGAPELVDYRYNKSVFLLADGAENRERIRRVVEQAGCRVSGIASLAEGAERFGRPVTADAFLVHFERDSTDHLDALLAGLDVAAREGRHGGIVSGPVEMVDAVAAGAWHQDIHLLCEPDPRDWAEAITAATVRRRPWLNDVSKERGTPRLQQLSEEVGRIATILASLSEEDEGAAAEAGLEARGSSRRIEASQIRAIIRARRMRDHFFKSDLFADPAWDMLLDLMAARLEQQKVAVSSLCIAAAVPPTTALRWIKTLSEQGLFVRVADAEDGRRVFIELSDRAAADLEAYLKSAERISPLII